MTDLERIVTHLNGTETQEACRPWQEQIKIACGPHPHTGPHRLQCECGKIFEVRNKEGGLNG